MIVRFGAALCGAMILSVYSSVAMPAKPVETKTVEKKLTGNNKHAKNRAAAKSAADKTPGLLSFIEKGIASIYAYEGEKTANGEFANPKSLTAAHKSLPLGTKVRVTNEGNKQSVVVRINDRGPYVKGRIIDLTPAGAQALGFGAREGLAKVSVAVESPVPLPRKRYVGAVARS